MRHGRVASRPTRYAAPSTASARSARPAAIRQHAARGPILRCRLAASIGASASSISSRASPMSRSRRDAVLLEAAAQQIADAARRRRRQRLPVDVALEHVRERVRDGLLGERRAARQHLEQDAAERPDVGALVERPAARLFRAHVRRRAEDRPPAHRASPSASAPSRAAPPAPLPTPSPGRSRAP